MPLWESPKTLWGTKWHHQWLGITNPLEILRPYYYLLLVCGMASNNRVLGSPTDWRTMTENFKGITSLTRISSERLLSDLSPFRRSSKTEDTRDRIVDDVLFGRPLKYDLFFTWATDHAPEQVANNTCLSLSSEGYYEQGNQALLLLRNDL